MTTAQDQQSRASQKDFEAWSKNANQGYDLTKMHSGKLHTYEDDKTEHAWRGFFYGWQAARTLPAPDNVRAGEPYDNPAFEELARTMGVWGTAQAALCAQFFLAGRALPARGVDPMLDTPADMEPAAYRWRWKTSGSALERRFADPDLYGWAYRDECPTGEAAAKMEIEQLYTAAQVQAMGRVPPGWKAVERQLLEDAEQALANFVSEHDWGDSDMVAMDNLSAVLAAAPWPPAAQERKPLFWVRLLRDGLYEGPVHANSSEGKMLRDAKPDEWHPLYLGQAEPRPQPTPFPADFAQAYWRDRSGAPDL